MSDSRANHRVAYFNGKIVPEREVVLPFRDRGFKQGDAAFDMTRTFNGRAFRLNEHIDRFYRSLRYLRLDPGMSPQEMIEISEQIVLRNDRELGHKYGVEFAEAFHYIGPQEDAAGKFVGEHSVPLRR